YAVLTPARDEAADLPRLERCLAAQTVPPALWVVIENGSSDGTDRVASALAAEHDWIHAVSAPPGPARVRGAPVVRALHEGLAALDERFDVVAKVDADVSLEPDYFERLLHAFEAEPALGLASGGCLELVDGAWRERRVTGSHVWGAARAYRRACLDDVLPLDERMGWDGLDQIRAAARGWQVGRIAGLAFRHHRLEGTRDGSRRRVWAAQGSAAYYMRYRVSYVLLRTLHRARSEPAALALLGAYVAAALRREARCSDREVTERLRRQQRARHLLARVREVSDRGAGLRSG
ncbi:MAG TPA: glycosyltransferase family A protein, partial [Gaiellaceae bacterium]|nr:glycosyltransferase family A protein [Gaiellaceae bacterium]